MPARGGAGAGTAPSLGRGLAAQRVVERGFGDGLVAVWLFGSRARGDRLSEDLDVDLLVVTRGRRERDLQRVTQLVFAAGAAEDGDPTRFASRHRSRRGRWRIRSFFMQDVERDRVVLAGGR